MPKDPALSAIYERALADKQDGEDARLVDYMTNSWLRTYAAVRSLPRLDPQTEALRRVGIIANLSAAP